jgi:hypothetical protein
MSSEVWDGGGEGLMVERQAGTIVKSRSKLGDEEFLECVERKERTGSMASVRSVSESSGDEIAWA